jgi:hypothetical protein
MLRRNGQIASGQQKSGGSAENEPEWVLANPSNHTILLKKAVRIASQRVTFPLPGGVCEFQRKRGHGLAQKNACAMSEAWKISMQGWTKYKISARAWKKSLERKMLPSG